MDEDLDLITRTAAGEREAFNELVTKYQKRISGPLLDRIDIHIEVPRVDYDKLSGERLGEPSESIRKRVQAARDVQRTRFTPSPIASGVLRDLPQRGQQHPGQRGCHRVGPDGRHLL